MEIAKWTCGCNRKMQSELKNVEFDRTEGGIKMELCG